MTISSFHNVMPRNLGGVQPIEKIAQPEAGGGAEKTGGAPGASFSNFLEHAVGEIDSKMHAAGAEQAKLLTGETNNVHQAMIAMQEASVAFTLMVEVRNKLVESYQELMRMQV